LVWQLVGEQRRQRETQCLACGIIIIIDPPAGGSIAL